MVLNLLLVKEVFIEIVCSLTSLIRALIFFRFSSLSRERTNNKVIVLMNGPSLSDDLIGVEKDLFNYDLVCCNNFSRSELYEKLKPSKYVLLDRTYFGVQNGLTGSVDVFEEISKRTTWPIELFIPADFKKDKKVQELLHDNSNVVLRTYNRTGLEGLNWCTSLMMGFKLGLPRPHNVLIAALYIVIYQRYKEISIIGAENGVFKTVVVDKNNVLHKKMSHFYENNQEAQPLSLNDGREKVFLHDFLLSWATVFKGYHVLKYWADEKSLKIINRTSSSMIDAFDKKSF